MCGPAPDLYVRTDLAILPMRLKCCDAEVMKEQTRWSFLSSNEIRLNLMHNMNYYQISQSAYPIHKT